jgi:hypothetical protein
MSVKHGQPRSPARGASEDLANHFRHVVLVEVDGIHIMPHLDAERAIFADFAQAVRELALADTVGVNPEHLLLALHLIPGPRGRRIRYVGHSIAALEVGEFLGVSKVDLKVCVSRAS